MPIVLKWTLIPFCLLTFKEQKPRLFMFFHYPVEIKRKPPLGCRGAKGGLRYESPEQHGVANRFRNSHHADKYRYHDVGIVSTLFFHFSNFLFVP